MSRSKAVEAIKKKLKGQQLSSKEIFNLMDEIANQRLGPVLTAYFAAAGFSQGFTDNELYYLTRGMVDSGKKLKFKGVVADKHSIGGLAGTRTSLIVVPIIAAAGIKIPKTSSRAITTAAGTADTMEVLAPVEHSVREIKEITERLGGCIVWGGHLGIAPADDVIIRIEKPLAFESYDKVVVSVMAKKIAVGSTHIIIDIPKGPFMKVRHKKDAIFIGQKFHYLAERFKTKLIIDVNSTYEPAGFGIGPTLEIDDVLAILNQDKDRPRKLEERALGLASKLLDLCFKDLPGRKGEDGKVTALKTLNSSKALEKFREIVKAQGGDPNFSRKKLKFGKQKLEIKSKIAGKVKAINTKEINAIARILGSPDDKKAGIKLRSRLGDKLRKNDILLTLFSSSKWRLQEASETLKQLPIYYLEK
jgi:AMP phosphorylase